MEYNYYNIIQWNFVVAAYEISILETIIMVPNHSCSCTHTLERAVHQKYPRKKEGQYKLLLINARGSPIVDRTQFRAVYAAALFWLHFAVREQRGHLDVDVTELRAVIDQRTYISPVRNSRPIQQSVRNSRPSKYSSPSEPAPSRQQSDEDLLMWLLQSYQASSTEEHPAVRPKQPSTKGR